MNSKIRGNGKKKIQDVYQRQNSKQNMERNTNDISELNEPQK